MVSPCGAWGGERPYVGCCITRQPRRCAWLVACRSCVRYFLYVSMSMPRMSSGVNDSYDGSCSIGPTGGAVGEAPIVLVRNRLGLHSSEVGEDRSCSLLHRLDGLIDLLRGRPLDEVTKLREDVTLDSWAIRSRRYNSASWSCAPWRRPHGRRCTGHSVGAISSALPLLASRCLQEVTDVHLAPPPWPVGQRQPLRRGALVRPSRPHALR